MNPFAIGSRLARLNRQQTPPDGWFLGVVLRELGLTNLAEIVDDMRQELNDAGLRQCDATHGCRQWFESRLHDACPNCAPAPEPVVSDDARQVEHDYARAVGAPR